MARIRKERLRVLQERFTVVRTIPFRKFRGAVVPVLLIVCLAAVLMTFFSTSAVNAVTVEAIGVGVYWDSGCSNVVSAIDWGVLNLGETENVIVYVRNEGSENAMLSVRTNNWNPSNAFNFMTLSWNYAGNSIAPSEIVKIKLTLSISPHISEITNFRFNITIEAQSPSEVVPGDANGDGYVNVADLVILAQAWYTQPGDPKWDPRGDLNKDNIINLYDLIILAENWVL